MKLTEIFAVLIGGIGIIVLDLAFSASSASDLFFFGSYLSPGKNFYIYLIGGGLLGVAMLILILVNRHPVQAPPQAPQASRTA